MICSPNIYSDQENTQEPCQICPQKYDLLTPYNVKGFKFQGDSESDEGKKEFVCLTLLIS